MSFYKCFFFVEKNSKKEWTLQKEIKRNKFIHQYESKEK